MPRIPILRCAVAHEIVSVVRHKGIGVPESEREVVYVTPKREGGEGGIIAVDPRGRFTITFNSKGMYRDHIGGDGIPRVVSYAE